MKSKVRLHDSTQFEIITNMKMSHTEHQTIDLFLFLPHQLPEHYSRKTFYGDITQMQRMEPPKSAYFIAELEYLLSTVEQRGDNLDLQTPYIAPCKYLLFLWGAYMNRILKKWRTAVRRGDLPQCHYYADEIVKQKRWFQSTVFSRFGKPKLSVPPEIQATVQSVYRYSAIRTAWLIGPTARKKNEFSDTLAEELVTLLRQDLAYLRSTRAPEESDIEWKEHILQIHSALKKLVTSPLFVNQKRKSLEKRYRNYLAAGGAALAASWSFMAEAQRYKIAQGADFGFRTTLIPLIFVGAYVLKDRIKELSREFLNSRLSPNFPDYHADLYQDNIAGDTVPMGSLKESLYFSKRNLPEDIDLLYRLNIRSEYDELRSNTCIQYSRDFLLTGNDSGTGTHQMLRDIIRLNISQLSTNMDDSARRIPIFSSDGEKDSSLLKTYSLDLLLKLTNGPDVSLGHYRFFLNKQRIIRMEEITATTKLRDFSKTAQEYKEVV